MKEFDFKVTQSASTYFRGNLTIEARSKKDAIKKILKMSEHEIEIKTTDWELSEDGAEGDGPLEVCDENGILINGE